VATVNNAVEKYGQLQVKGNRIMGKDDKPVQLRGMSFFWSQWIGKYYTPEAVKWLRDDWRCTVVRAALAVDHDGYLKNPEAEKQKVITVVDAAIAQGLYVIIDWHDHEAEKHVEQAKAFFAEMAQRYGDKPNVIYEIYNEPLNVSWSGVIKPYSEAVIAAIRQHDPDNLVICGTRNWSQEIEEVASDPIKLPNVAYTLHFYAATHKQWLRDAATRALSKGVALMVTEYGTCEASGNGVLDRAETQAWWKFMDENSISWCNWSLADKEETSAALKPGAKATGNWTDNEISPSGLFVREELRANNPK
jgi:endoglucanase